MKNLVRKPITYLLIVLTIIIFSTGFISLMLRSNPVIADPEFSAQRAYSDILAQVAMGPRVPGSRAHIVLQEYIHDQLKPHGWSIETQRGTYQGQRIANIIARRGSGKPWVILAAHYDTRFISDRDPIEANRTTPVPGANDGASGVAVLLELARVLPRDLDKTLWLVFFDAEDQGRVPGWDWIMGSRFFVDTLDETPDAVVVVDMVGDSDLNIYYEVSSDISLRKQIWHQANSLGYDAFFIPEEKHSILDDHTPFLENGIPAILMIDFDYPYWHTVQDTSDKVTANSLKIVGDTLLAWLTTP